MSLRRTLNLTLVAVISLSIVVGACEGTPASPNASTPRTPLSVGLGYIPSVQFAPFYLAEQSGAYERAGLDVTIQNQIDPDLINLVGSGAVDIALADGTSVIPAVSNGIPIRYMATVYGILPNVVIARADAGISKPSDLETRKVGTPGQYGSGYLTLLGILAEASLEISDVQLELYPDFGQTQALITGQADAVTGYANNDLLQAEAAGLELSVFYASASAPFAGPGLISSPETIAAKRDAIRAFIAVTLDAMQQISANPDLGVDAAAKVVSEVAADEASRAKSLAIMKATISVWRGPVQATMGLGAIDRAGWATSLEFLRGLPGQGIRADLTVGELLDESLLP
ncbi:MAG: ABC transporter substrate-binding protein [Candidatus Limnocylindrus sp.]